MPVVGCVSLSFSVAARIRSIHIRIDAMMWLDGLVADDSGYACSCPMLYYILVYHIRISVVCLSVVSWYTIGRPPFRCCSFRCCLCFWLLFNYTRSPHHRWVEQHVPNTRKCPMSRSNEDDDDDNRLSERARGRLFVLDVCVHRTPMRINRQRERVLCVPITNV